MARTSWVPPRNKKGIRDLQLGLSWMRPGPKCCPLCSTEEPNGFVFLTAPPPPTSLPQCQGCSLEAGWWSVAQANASVQIYWNASSFLWIFWLVICVGRGPYSVPPKLEHILWKGWSHHSHLGRGQSFIVH